MIDIIGELKRIQNMTAAETFVQSTDSLEAISNAIAAVIASLGQLGRPEIQHYEGWQDELGIDMTLWNLTHPATTPTIRGVGVAPMAGDLVATVDMILNETGRIVSTFRNPINPDLWGVNSILRLTHFEFEMAVQNPANLDNALTVWGLTPNQADTRASDYIYHFNLPPEVVTLVPYLTLFWVISPIMERIPYLHRNRHHTCSRLRLYNEKACQMPNLSP